jgi:NAD(P)-dependent dehydrogenase (short-subunit alcohol dehydrogenase family)
MTETSTGDVSGRLRGKSALITGAAAGIGRATAELFAREGARLVLADINTDGLSALRDSLADVAADVALVTADVSKPPDARQMIEVAVEHYGRLDIAVANAGIIPLASIVEATPEGWDEVMSIDGRGMFLTCKYAIEQMITTGGGSIVCLSSISGMAGQSRQSTYGPAKFVPPASPNIWLLNGPATVSGSMRSRQELSTPSGCSSCRTSRVVRSTWRW